MNSALLPKTLGISVALTAFLLLVSALSPGAAQSPAGNPDFLQPQRCYQFTFAVTGAPNWKVLEVLGAGWIKAEIDEGPAAAQRPTVWVNTSQLLTVRERRCSG